MHIIYITVRNKIAVNPAQDRYVCGNSDFSPEAYPPEREVVKQSL